MTSPAVVLARADVRRLVKGFDSELERWWDTHGALIIGNECASAVVMTYYHPLTFHLPGGTYTPDFKHILADGRVVLVEVKALIVKTKYVDHPDGTTEAKQVHNSRAQYGYRDARAKLRAAASIYPCFLWAEARIGKRGAYEIEFING